MDDQGDENNTIREVKSNSFSSVFMDADYIDVLLMTVGFFGSIADGVTTPVMLVITSKIMNSLGSGFGDDPDVLLGAITKSCIAFLYLACGIFVACFLEAYCWTRTGERQASRMRHKYLKSVLRQDVGYFDLKGSNTSVVVTSVINDTLLIQDVIGEKIPHFLANTSTLIGSQIIAFVLLWRIAIVGLPFVFILVAPGLVYGRILMGLTAKLREEYGKASSIVEETISSVRTVYSFVGENKTMKKFSVALQGSLKLGLKQGLVKGLAIGSHGVSFVVWAFLSWYGSRLVMYHGSDGGDVFAAGASIAVGGIAFGQGLASMKMIFEAYTAAVRMREVIKRVPEIDTDNLEGEILQSVSGEVEFKNIKFAYPSRPESMVLENFNLIVPAGKTVALVGGSGSGKSTVIALLERFYNPDHGEILFDGVAISKLQIKWLRSQMGLVSQEPALFATSIKENILFGKEDATIDEVIEATKQANAHDFISQFPQGYDTQVGERGVQMSGGQKQRIAIARAIIKSPRILLLDEATSALDSESERIVQEALDNASVGRTTIVIAHRLSTIRNADFIVVVRDGKVMESGSHEKLIQNKNGLYSSLVRMQQMEKTEGEDNSRTISRSSSHHLHSRSAKVVSRTRSANSVPQGSAISVEENTEKHIVVPVPVSVPSLKRLLLLNAPEWKHACVGYTSAAFYGAVQPVFAYVLGSLISIYFLTDHDEIKSKSREYALYFFGLGVFSMVISLCQHYSFAVMGEYLTKRIRERMLSKILTFEVGWFDQDENSSGAVCSRLEKDAISVRSLVGDRMSLLIQTFSAVTLACTLGMIIAWRLALVMTAVQPLIIVCYYQRNVLLKRLSSKTKASQDESSKLAAEAVSNLRTIAAFSSQARILGLFYQAQDGPRRDSIYQSWFAGLGLGLAQSLTSCTWSLDYWYGGKLVSQEYITAKELFQTFMILVSTGIVIANAGSMTSDLAKGSDAVASFFVVLDRYTRIEPEDKEGSHPEKMIGNIEFDNIHFAYPARPNVIIFKGFSISIEAGNSTALVGQSGSGKSSIISLIERFYDPLKGTISIDGRDIKSYHLRSLRKHIALVSQEPTLFGGTIRENIEYGSSDKVNEAEIINAARSANAHDFITALKDGYDTWCGEKGLQLSGGQKQRIAIARAILKNPAILLLDEATSALDSQSENVVQQALDRVMVGRTSVVVAHRLSTIQKCDMIAVLEKGNVVEKGTHSSLMGKGYTGAYYGLVSIQQRKTDTNDI